MAKSDRQARNRTYVNLFLAYSNRLERWIRLTFFVLIALLLAFQTLLTLPQIRQALSSVDRLEGVPAERK